MVLALTSYGVITLIESNQRRWFIVSILSILDFNDKIETNAASIIATHWYTVPHDETVILGDKSKLYRVGNLAVTYNWNEKHHDLISKDTCIWLKQLVYNAVKCLPMGAVA